MARRAYSKTNPSDFDGLFWGRVDSRTDPGGCWPWTGSLRDGYGRIHMPRLNPEEKFRHERTHRIAWRLSNGPIPDGLFVLHRCDNRACCRPSHLFLGTCQDNMADMFAKGRNKVGIKGLRSANANLPDKVVREVRRMARDGRRFKHIGAELGIDPRGVSRIVAGTLYGRVKDKEETQ
jgi:hypothetical protein